jgi:hypothetical protein
VAVPATATNLVYPTIWIKMAVAPPLQWWCTALTTAVYTEHAGATSFSAALGQGQVATALGVAVPPDRVAVPTQYLPLGLLQPVTTIGWRCTGQGMVVPSGQHPEPGYTSFSSPFSPPLQMC